MRTLMLICALALSGCGGPKGDGSPQSVDGQQVLSQERLKSTTRSANGGDIDSMRTLAVHYGAAGDLQKAMHWLSVASDIGDVNSMLDLTSYLVTIGGEKGCAEARTVLERAKQNATTVRHGRRIEILTISLSHCR
jgi:TPR repeat protein